MKKVCFSLGIIIVLMLVISFIRVNDILVKRSIFKIIDKVENISLKVMTSNGERQLTGNSKIDFSITYIIENMKDFNLEKSEDYYIEYGTLYYNLGKIKKEEVRTVANTYFLEEDFSINDHKFYNNEYVELNVEPIEYSGYDYKNILEIEKIDKNLYSVDVEYIRELNGKQNKFYVNYSIYSKGDITKIKDIVLYESILI